MSVRERRLLGVLLLLGLVGASLASCGAQTHERSAEPAAPGPDATPAAPVHAEAAPVLVEAAPAADSEGWGDVLSRIRLVGASATNGFGTSLTAGGGTAFARGPVDLAMVLDAAITRSHEDIRGRSDLMFFAGPMQIGPRIVSDTLAEDPTLVVAVDFVFWFGYGGNDRAGVRIVDEASRLELLDEGLALLDQFECPVVVGDFPDMSPAVGLMLSSAQMPRADTLEALNERLRAWAGQRPNAVVVPLARLVNEMRGDVGIRIGAWSWPAGSATRLLQADQLHPTVEGLIAMALLVADTLERGDFGVTADDFATDPELVLETLKDKMLAERRSP